MSDVIVVAVLGAMQAITLTLINRNSKRSKRTEEAVTEVGKDAKAAKEQVVNNHDTNLREENDKRHSETLRWFSALSAKFDRQENRLDRYALRLDGIAADMDTKRDKEYDSH